MNKFLSFLARWQGLWALIAVGFLFFVTPWIFRWFGTNSGVIDFAYVQALVFSTGVFFTAIFSAWLAIQLDWKIINNHIEEGDFIEDWRRLTAFQRTAIIFSSLAFLIFAFILCFFALPKP